MQLQTDVFVAGGGPAGLAAAIAARRRGFHVVLADPAGPGQDKACGEGLMPDGVAAASAIGIELEHLDSYAFRGIRFHAAGKSVAGDFAGGAGRGIRRTVLHRALADYAANAGVQVLWGRRVEGIAGNQVRLPGDTVQARYIVGADGAQSRVRAWAELEEARNYASRVGYRRHYTVAPWSSHMELYWSKRAQLYVTPVAEREICVALISRDPRLRLDSAMQLFPDARARLGGALTNSSEKGSVTVSRRLRAVTRGAVALVGDASGSVDAITGQGLSLSFQQSAALADAMLAGDLSLYQSAHERLMRHPRFMAGLMLALDGRGWLQRSALAAMSRWPRSFQTLLEFHAGVHA
jgi:menaquinone-9 beta-reductase